MARHTTALAPKSPLHDPLHDPLLSTTEVCAIFKCHYTTLWRRLKKDETFPRPIQLSVKRLAWYESEILAFLKSQPRVHTSAYSN